MLKFLFSDAEVHFNYRHPDLQRPTSQNLEFDIFLPSLAIAVEYHGEMHYKSHVVFGELKMRQDRDKVKREICAKEGITLIEIPFWWDNSEQSLIATLQQYRPELLTDRESSFPIPSEIPPRLATMRHDNYDTLNLPVKWEEKFLESKW
jgi:hypothetical protein